MFEVATSVIMPDSNSAGLAGSTQTNNSSSYVSIRLVFFSYQLKHPAAGKEKQKEVANAMSGRLQAPRRLRATALLKDKPC